MTNRLDDKIRSLMVHVVEASPTTEELEGVMELLRSAEPEPLVAPLPRRVEQPRWRWLTAVASAAAVLVLVGGAALLFRVVGSDTPVATTPVGPVFFACLVAGPLRRGGLRHGAEAGDE